MIAVLHSRLQTGFERLRSGSGLASRLARGGLWLGAGSGIENALRFARNMILTRILAQEALGVMAIVLAVNSAFEAFTEIGIKEAIIQNPRGVARPCLNAAWWLAFGRGLGLFALACLAAPWIARFYGQPELTAMLRVAFLSIVFNGALSARAYTALKEMNYRPWVAINQGGNICGVAAAIVLSLALRSAWGLVLGFVAESAARCLISYIVRPYRPGLVFERDSVRALLRYAGGMAGLPVLTMLYAKTDIFVVGKLCPKSALGLYSMASALAFIPDVLCATVIAPLLMPAFSSLQHDLKLLGAGILRALRILGLIFLPLLTAMACAAPALLGLAYGPAYAAASVPFALFCAAIACRVAGWGLVTAFFATGRPGLSRRASAARLAALALVIIPLTHRLGLSGAALAGLISGLVWLVYIMAHLRQVAGLTAGRYLAALGPGVAAGAAIGVGWLVIDVLKGF